MHLSRGLHISAAFNSLHILVVNLCLSMPLSLRRLQGPLCCCYKQAVAMLLRAQALTASLSTLHLSRLEKALPHWSHSFDALQ